MGSNPRSSEPLCFASFRSALQKHTIYPKRPEHERLTGSQWRGDGFILLTEFTQWLINGQRERSSPLEDLLREVYLEDNVAPTVNHILEGQTRCLVTFCILLEIGQPKLLRQFQRARVLDDHLPMTLAPLEEKVQEALRDADKYDFDLAHRIAVAFNRHQWKYFPAELSAVGQRWSAPHVLPFVDRQLITDKGGTSTVYQVAVPERFVAKNMKNQVASSMETHPDFEALGNCCHFALKVFEADNKNIFQDEVEAYRTVTENKGMLMYLGDFTLVDGNHTTHTIVLEYAESDLSEYFYRTPPVLPAQILSFWTEIASIAPTLGGLHKFKIIRFKDEHTYEGWHADIKSDNILFVDGKVKLADPGFAKFQRRKEGPSGHLLGHQFTGGTTTYGAPERHNSAEKVTNPRASDMWSFGCVLSECATWIVLGRSGIRQFRDLRVDAIQTQTAQRPVAPSKRDIQYDFFHDGRDVLHEVKEWHKALRQLKRPTDTLTDKILDLVDHHLLITNPSERFEAADVCKWFNKHLPKAREMAILLSGLSGAVQEAISNGLEKEAEELQNHLESCSKIARKAAKVDPTYLQVPGFTNPSKAIPSRATSLRIEVPEDNSMVTKPALRRWENGHDYAISELPEIEGRSTNTSEPLVSSQQSKSQAKNRTRYCIFHAHYTFMDRGLCNEEDKGSNTKATGFLKKLRSGSNAKDARLAEYIKNRDLVFIIDNGATMNPFWYEAVFVLETLYNKCRGSDDDGVDLYFTCGANRRPPDRVEKAKGDQGWKTIKSRVWDQSNRPKPDASTNMQWILTQRLSAWLDEYEKRRAEMRVPEKHRKYKGALKDLTIIILTDGIWKAHQNNSTAVDEAIIEFNERFRRVAGTSMPERTVSIQFVSFGSNTVALERFQRLDDDLGQKGVPDIVDHERATGDVYKMLAGSVIEGLDHLDGAEAVGIASSSNSR